MAEVTDRRPLEDVDDFLRTACAQIELERADAAGSVSDSADALRQVAGRVLEILEELDDDDDGRVEELTALGLQATEMERDIRHRDLTLRAQRHAGVEEAFGRLRHLRSSAELLDAVCREIVDGCGFRRAMLSRVQASTWRPWMVHFSGDRLRGRAFLEWIEEREVQLDQLPLERSVVTGREPEIVHDAAADPRTYKPFVEAGRLRSYVVAPIIPAGRVVGLLHADHGADGQVGEVDRGVLSAFAEAFGRLYERMVVLERMHAQRSYVRETFAVAETLMVALAGAEIELDGARDDDERAIREFIDEPTSASEAIDEMLTAREQDVLAMLVRGYSNAEIAERLVIKVGTVKSHVKRILRKVGAVNRAEAISRYMDGRPD